MVQGGMSMLKYLMFVFNFIFVICGIVLIVIGAIVQSRGDLTEFLGSKYVTAPTIIIAIGILIFVLAFLGCCGAIKENSCMVTLFGILLFIILIVEIAGGIYAYTHRGELEGFLKERMEDSLSQLKNDSIPIWDEMQQEMKCCGVNGFDDYVKYNHTIPTSCYADQEDRKNIFKDGCFDKLFEVLKSKAGLVGGAAIGIAVIELLGCMFAWCLSSAIKRDYEGV